MDETYAGMAHRQVVSDLDTPDALEARLALLGWTLDTVIQHVLVGPLALDRVRTTAPEDLELRAAATDRDWESIRALTRSDHLEEAADEGRPPWPEALTQDMVDHRREKAPQVQAWVARIDGTDVGMFSSLPGPAESAAPGEADPDLAPPVGLVEDLFVEPAWRGRGISVALIDRCVADARHRGAGPVVIGSEPTDWPKGLYARLGFTPRWVQHWWRRPPAAEPGS
jgi:GNAT superfamily N-acetyltransferase